MKIIFVFDTICIHINTSNLSCCLTHGINMVCCSPKQQQKVNLTR